MASRMSAVLRTASVSSPRSFGPHQVAGAGQDATMPMHVLCKAHARTQTAHKFMQILAVPTQTQTAHSSVPTFWPPCQRVAGAQPIQLTRFKQHAHQRLHHEQSHTPSTTQPLT